MMMQWSRVYVLKLDIPEDLGSKENVDKTEEQPP